MNNKLFSVTMKAGTDQKSGFVKAETMQEVLDYCAKEYPNYKVEYIRETGDVIL